MKADRKREKLKKKSQARRDAEAARTARKEEAEAQKAEAGKAKKSGKKESGAGRKVSKKDKKTEEKRVRLYEKTNADRVTAGNRWRLAGGFAFILICMSVLILRMGYWQIYRSDELRTMAAEMQKVDTEIDPVRGSIYDAQMTTLAESVTEYELYAYTQYLYKDESISVTDKGKTLTRLSEICGKDREEIRKLLEGDENLVLLADGLTREQVEEAEKQFGNNVTVKTRAARYYPNGAFAAQVLGGVNADNVGRSGLEYEYNSTLAGVKGRTVRLTDNNGDTLSNGKARYYKAQNGRSIVTTIDSVIQHFVEDALETGMDKTGADAITCIVMNPKTGDILAMATSPEYDPNNSSEPSDPGEKKKFKKMSPEEQTDYLSRMWTITAVSDIYEPGSTFKLITAASALESGSANSKSRYYCDGSIYVDGWYLHCLGSHGWQDLKTAVGHSCNPGLAKVALDMGGPTFYNYIDLFGLTDQTGVDLPGEGYSIVKDPETMPDVDLATTGYGQGIAITPLQLLCAVNCFGNGGVLMKPKVVKKILDEDGNTVQEIGDVKVRQVVSEGTADKLRDIMEYYVSSDEAGGTTAYVPGYRVGGKTGTANRVSGNTYSDATNASFVAMAPMDDPQISMIVIVYRPTKGQYGAYTAGPIVKEIMEKTLKYLGVEPVYTKSEEEETKEKQVTVPDVTGMDSSDAERNIRYSGLKCTVMPETSEGQSFVVVDQHPKAGTKADEGSTVYIYSE